MATPSSRALSIKHQRSFLETLRRHFLLVPQHYGVEKATTNCILINSKAALCVAQQSHAGVKTDKVNIKKHQVVWVKATHAVL